MLKLYSAACNEWLNDFTISLMINFYPGAVATILDQHQFDGWKFPFNETGA